MKIIGQTAESSKMTSEKQLLPDMVLGGGIHLSSCTDTNYCGQDAYADMLVTERERETVWAVGNGQMHQVHLQSKVGALNTMHDQIMILIMQYGD